MCSGTRAAQVALTTAFVQTLQCSTHPLRILARLAMHILWVIIIGFVAGIIARLLAPGPNNPAGFILTTLLGIVGAFCRHFHRSSDRLVSARSERGPDRRRRRRTDRLVH